MPDKAFYTGIVLKILAKDEKEAGQVTQDIADALDIHDLVIDAYWDNNLPEEEYKEEEI